MPTPRIDPPTLARIERAVSAAIALLDPNGYDARDVQARDGAVNYVALYFDRAGNNIGWNVRITNQTSCTNVDDQATLERHGQARHFGNWRAYAAGVRKFVTYHKRPSYERGAGGAPTWTFSLKGSHEKPHRCACHDYTTGAPLSPPRS